MEVINIHSLTDLITNSSTTICTYSDQSPKILENLIDEFFKASGIDKKCGDIFDIILLVDTDGLSDFIFDEGHGHTELENIPKKYTSNGYEALNKLMGDIASKKIKKPKWLSEAESKYEEYCEYFGRPSPSTRLCVNAKDPKYENLAKLVIEFLYSVDHESYSDG